ncbi:unnamed protein product [Strongylus vulgaris]|uniref:Ribosome biogenesis protein NOP53 n=1 Tax=Strongylus vulgaris TaxID=40348 RepID=A0A3P7JVA2_STRVU|nr:unnamed protein product [Strongylus vulgaris]
MVSLSSVKIKPAASRTSRHKKKYWRKGTDITAIEKNIHDNTHNSVANMPDRDLYSIDRTPSNDVKKFTKRQQAALDKISKSLSVQKLPLPPPKCPSLKKQPKLKQPVKRVEKVQRKQEAPGFDLWEKEFEPKVDLEYQEAGEHMLLFTKKKLPHKPVTASFKPSLLDHVAVPDAGTSYNPKAEDYEKYVMKIAREETELIREEEKIEKGRKPKYESVVTHKYVMKIAQEETKLIREEEKIEKGRKPKYESVVTHAEKSLEETEGLVIDPRYNAEDDEIIKKDEEDGEIEEAMETAKSFNKELARTEQEIAENAAKRKKEKFLKKMTTRQKLGGGEFKDEEEPFLLKEELSDSLRKLKPQGHVLNDRIASLQKRNMLPIGGPKNKNKLKTKLKRKFVEKRLVKEVTKGSRVM